MPRILIALVIVTLTVYTFIDCLRLPSVKMPGKLPKVAWAFLTLLVPIIGPLIWLYFRYQHVLRPGTSIKAPSLGNPFNREKPSPGPVAPDDDPEFISRLEAQSRRRAYEQRKAEENPATNEKQNTESDEDEPENRGLYG
ncbi:MAG: PLD nuclease N-terminal domain-containing protein [Arcanobacterium sp.]|nr:PLD nuclease N-terminal domain-containing protein [Arcanobacterium sp.]